MCNEFDNKRLVDARGRGLSDRRKSGFPHERAPAFMHANLALYRHFVRSGLELRGGGAETKYATVASVTGMLTYHECSCNCVSEAAGSTYACMFCRR